MIHTVSITDTHGISDRDNLSQFDDTHGINLAGYDVDEGDRVAPLGDAGGAQFFLARYFFISTILILRCGPFNKSLVDYQHITIC